MKYLILVCLLLSGRVYSNTVTECIQFGEDVGRKSRTMKNVCDKTVMVLWCHHSDKVSPELKCGANDKFYHQFTELKPNDVKVNQFSLPLAADVSYGVCFGSYNSYRTLGNDGRYTCVPTFDTSNEKNKKMIITSKGKNKDEACVNARNLNGAGFGSGGNMSECACSERGNITICQVEISYGSGKENDKAFNDLRTKLRKIAECDPKKRYTLSAE